MDANPVSDLQGHAWAIWNASYHAPEAEAYRRVSLSLYQQDVHARIEVLFQELDRQNALLDAMLRPRAA